MRPESKRVLFAVVLPLALASAWLQFAPRRETSQPTSGTARVDQARAEAETALATLRAELVQRPNPAGWAALGGAEARLGRWAEALDAFAKVGPTLDARADWLSSAAEAGFHANGQRFDELARGRVHRALELEPRHPPALTLAATDAMQSAEWNRAIEYWQRLLPLLPAQSDDAQAVADALQQAQQAQGRAAKQSPPG